MTDVQIEKPLPIPKLNRYHFESWQVGQSKFYETLREVEACASAAYSYARYHNNGFRMTRRVEGDGYRIWRIE